MRRIPLQTTTVIFVLAVALLGTAMAIFMIPPEEVRATTEDGAVRALATVRGTAQGQLDRLMSREEAGLDMLESPIYAFEHAGEPLAQPLRIEVSADAPWLAEWPPDEITALIRDLSLGVWRPLETDVDAAGRLISVNIPSQFVHNQQLLFAFGRVSPPPDPARRDIIVDELLSFPPPDAVGYRVFHAYSRMQQDFVLKDDALDYGGCGGVFHGGDTQTMTSQDAHMADITHRIGVIWQLEDGGCKEDTPFASAR